MGNDNSKDAKATTPETTDVSPWKNNVFRSELLKLQKQQTLEIENFLETDFSTPNTYTTSPEELEMNFGTFFVSLGSHNDSEKLVYDLHLTVRKHDQNVVEPNKMLVAVKVYNFANELVKEGPKVEIEKFSGEKSFSILLWSHEDISKQKKKFPDDFLKFEITVFQNYHIRNKIEPMKDGSSLLLENVSSAFNSEDLSDFTINVSGQVFHAHKIILARRCRFFEAMFKTKMSEVENNETNIRNTKPEVFEEVLFYIYNGKISDVSHATLDLYEAANYFDLELLGEIVEAELQTNFSSENILEITKYANNEINNKSLLEKCLLFIHLNRQNMPKKTLELYYHIMENRD